VKHSLLALSFGLALLLTVSIVRAGTHIISWPRTDVAAIDVRVPAEAQLWFQGQKTQQQGSNRFFESPPLEAGKTYAYKVKAAWMNDKGENVERMRTLQVRAGDYLRIDMRND
jgi:uncharacterized protein (TIGR03000 family)